MHSVIFPLVLSIKTRAHKLKDHLQASLVLVPSRENLQLTVIPEERLSNFCFFNIRREFQQLTNHKILGEGAFGTVVLVKDRATDSFYAMKKVLYIYRILS